MTDITDKFSVALQLLWESSGAEDTLQAAELLHAVAAEITRVVRETGSAAGSHPDILVALAYAGIRTEEAP